MLLLELTLRLAVANGFVQLDVYKRDTPKRLARRGLDAVALHELPLQNAISFYQTELSVGTPPQLITVQLDTGSSDLWIMSSDNSFCKEHKCPDKTTFDKRVSKTLKLNASAPIFDIAYGDNTFASGVYVQDDITLRGFRHGVTDSHKSDLKQPEDKQRSDKEFLTIKDANFAIADRSNSSEAVWGIGMGITECITREVDAHGQPYPAYENLPMQMKTQGFIGRLAYSLWLNDLRSTVGSILFGAVDHAKFNGNLQRVPIVKGLASTEELTDFSVMLHGISAFNKNNMSDIIIDCSISVLLDSGTTYSQLPSQMLDAIAQTIGAEFEPRNEIYIVSQLRKKELNGGGLRFNLSNVVIEVPIDELLLPIGSLDEIRGMHEAEVDNQNHGPEKHTLWNVQNRKENLGFQDQHENFYLLGIFPVNSGTPNAYILGDTFLRSAYVTYDLEGKEVALANSNYNSTETQIEKLGSDGLSQFLRAKLYSSTSTSTEFYVYTQAAGLFAPLCEHSNRSPQSRCLTGQPAGSTNLTPLSSFTLTRYLSRMPDSPTTVRSMTVPSTHRLRKSHGEHNNGACSQHCFTNKLQTFAVLTVLYIIFLIS